jgi:hypothetical protein
MYKKVLLTVCATVTALLFSNANAYYQRGHLLVARIAYEKLNQSSRGQHALAAAEKLLREHT